VTFHRKRDCRAICDNVA